MWIKKMFAYHVEKQKNSRLAHKISLNFFFFFEFEHDSDSMCTCTIISCSCHKVDNDLDVMYFFKKIPS